MQKALGVSSSGYNDWCLRPDAQPDPPQLRDRIRHHFRRSRCSYGHRWIRRKLRKEGHRVGRKLVLRLMKAEDLKPSPSLPHPYKKAQGGEHRIAKWVLEDAHAVQMAKLDWIENWYNPEQRHSTLHGCSPVQFELTMAA